MTQESESNHKKAQATLLLDIFGARPDALLRTDTAGAAYTQTGMSSDELLALVVGHLQGGERVGLFSLQAGMVRFGCIDLDDHGPGRREDAAGDALRLARMLRAADVCAFVEITRRGNGRHVLTFFRAAIPAAEVRALLKAAVVAAQLIDGEKIEIFPKQDFAAKTGNGLWAPYCAQLVNERRSVVLAPETGEILTLHGFLEAAQEASVSREVMLAATHQLRADAAQGSMRGDSPTHVPTPIDESGPKGPVDRLVAALLATPSSRHSAVNKITLRCPYHADRTPSAVVFVPSLAIHCAACGQTWPFDKWTTTPEGRALVGGDLVDEIIALRRRREDDHGMPTDTAKAVLHTIEEILRASALMAPQRMYTSGFDALDALIGGFYARQLVIIPGATGSGKTGLICTLAAHWRKSAPVLIVPTEIDEVEQAARFAAPELGTTPAAILGGDVSATDAADAVREWPIFVFNIDTFETPDPVAAIILKARAVQASTGVVPIIAIDYGQQLASELAEQRRLSVSAVANGLRRAARDLDTAVIMVSSVGRAFYGQARKSLEGEEDPRAWLASAKESGDCEYSAAAVIYLDTSPVVNQAGESAARLIVCKARRGRCGFVGLTFHGPSGKFTENASAVLAMGPAARDSQDDRKVLDIVRGLSFQPVKDELRRQVPGLSHKRVDAALGRLLGAGELALRDTVRSNARRQQRAVKVVVVPGAEMSDAE